MPLASVAEAAAPMGVDVSVNASVLLNRAGVSDGTIDLLGDDFYQSSCGNLRTVFSSDLNSLPFRAVPSM